MATETRYINWDTKSKMLNCSYSDEGVDNSYWTENRLDLQRITTRGTEESPETEMAWSYKRTRTNDGTDAYNDPMGAIRCVRLPQVIDGDHTEPERYVMLYLQSSSLRASYSEDKGQTWGDEENLVNCGGFGRFAAAVDSSRSTFRILCQTPYSVDHWGDYTYNATTDEWEWNLDDGPTYRDGSPLIGYSRTLAFCGIAHLATAKIYEREYNEITKTYQWTQVIDIGTKATVGFTQAVDHLGQNTDEFIGFYMPYDDADDDTIKWGRFWQDEGVDTWTEATFVTLAGTGSSNCTGLSARSDSNGDVHVVYGVKKSGETYHGVYYRKYTYSLEGGSWGTEETILAPTTDLLGSAFEPNLLMWDDDSMSCILMDSNPNHGVLFRMDFDSAAQSWGDPYYIYDRTAHATWTFDYQDADDPMVVSTTSGRVIRDETGHYFGGGYEDIDWVEPYVQSEIKNLLELQDGNSLFLSWSENIPSGNIILWVRGSDNADMSGATGWFGPYTSPSRQEVLPSWNYDYVQWRAFMEASSETATPEITEVTIEYTAELSDDSKDIDHQVQITGDSESVDIDHRLYIVGGEDILVDHQVMIYEPMTAIEIDQQIYIAEVVPTPTDFFIVREPGVETHNYSNLVETVGIIRRKIQKDFGISQIGNVSVVCSNENHEHSYLHADGDFYPSSRKIWTWARLTSGWGVDLDQDVVPQFQGLVETLELIESHRANFVIVDVIKELLDGKLASATTFDAALVSGTSLESLHPIHIIEYIINEILDIEVFDFDTETFVDGAEPNSFDQAVTDSGGVTVNDTTWPAGSSIIQMIQDALKLVQGWMYTDGEGRINVGVYTSGAIPGDATEFIGSETDSDRKVMNLRLHPSRRDVVNYIVWTYGQSETELAAITDATSIANYGYRPLELSTGWETGTGQLTSIGNQLLVRYADPPDMVTFTCSNLYGSGLGLNAELGELIKVTDDSCGLDEDGFRIIEKRDDLLGRKTEIVAEQHFGS